MKRADLHQRFRSHTTSNEMVRNMWLHATYSLVSLKSPTNRLTNTDQIQTDQRTTNQHPTDHRPNAPTSNQSTTDQ